MPPALRTLLSLLCPFCLGNGELHSRARRYTDEPYVETHRTCPKCNGTGLDPVHE